MKKEKIFSLLNIKDYNNELEKILAKKNFSMDTKNLLLTMSYKIENAYGDYEKVKQEVLSKNKYMEKLISIINNKCYEFNTIMPNMPEFDDLKDKKFIIDTVKGAITVIDNEYYALKAITRLPKIEWGILDEYGLLKEPFCKVLTLGSIMHELEVLRDFNGWSWNVNIKEIEDIKCNLIYQCLVYLFENQFLTEWIENKQEMVDYIALAQNKLERLYGKEFSNDVITLICKVIMEYGMNNEIIDNRKMMTKKLDILLKKYSVDKKEIRLKLLQNKPTNVEEADKHLINQILQTTKNELGKLYNSKDFIKYLNYNSQNKSKMVNVYNKIYFEISKLEKNQNKLKLETSKAFIYAKIGTEGFKQMENNNECSDEYLENVIKYYKKGFEIIKQDFLNGKLDFSKRVLYTKRGIRKRML